MTVSVIFTFALVDSCVLKQTGEASVCIPIDECEEAKHRLHMYNEFPQTCGFVVRKPKVCCPKSYKPGEIARKGQYVHEKPSENLNVLHSYQQRATKLRQQGRNEDEKDRNVPFWEDVMPISSSSSLW